MGLTKCRECGSRVSERATACPSCGEPLKPASSEGYAGCGCLVLLFVIILYAGMNSKNTNNPMQNDNPQPKNLPNPGNPKQGNQNQDLPSSTKNWPFQFINTKTERNGRHNVMDLYAFSGTFNLAELRAFCRERKSKSPANDFYYVVIFDLAANAIFPMSPFTAEFGLEEEEEQKRHIRAIYLYNRQNGFSELRYYRSNAWDSAGTYEKI